MRIKKPKQGFKKLTKNKVRLIAHLIGDGCVFKSKTDYNIKYEVTDDDLLQQFESDLIEVYGLKPTKGYNPSGKTGKSIPFIRLRSKLVFDDLMRYCNYYSNNWDVPTQILNGKKEFRIEFLKALFDDEGSVIPLKKSAEIRLYSINLEGLEKIQTMIDKLNISNKIVKGYGSNRNVFAIVIKDIKKFHALIGFNSLRKQKKLEIWVQE